MTTTESICFGSVMETLFNHGVHYTIIEYPEMAPFRMTMVRLLWLERRLAAAEAVTEGLTSELLTLERGLATAVNRHAAIQPRSGLTLVGQAFSRFPWISLKWPWPCSPVSTAIRRTCRFIISAFSWRLAVVASAATEIWKRN